MPVKTYMTSLPPDASLHDSPPVRPGEKILWSPNPDWRLVRPAEVLSVNGDTINVVANTESGFQVKLACLHRHNPRAAQQLDRFNGGESGVWDVDPDTQLLRSLAQRVEALAQQVEALARARGNGAARPVRSFTPPSQMPMPAPASSPEPVGELVL